MWGKRRYTFVEIENMRVMLRYLSSMRAAHDASYSYWGREDWPIIEDQLRTYLQNSIEPTEIRKELDIWIAKENVDSEDTFTD